MLDVYFLALVIFLNNFDKGKVVANDFYNYRATDIDGQLVQMENYRGKVILVVNVASQCGFTDRHYSSLPKLKELLGRNDKLEILAFPCNQFGGQEPWSNEEIKRWVHENFKINFPLFSKIDVIDGNADPIFQYLSRATGKIPTWNFWKYLIDHTGKVQQAWGPWADIEEIFPQVRTAVERAEDANQLSEDRTIVKDDL